MNVHLIKRAHTICIIFLIASIVSLSKNTHANEIIVSKITTKHHKSTYHGSEIESIESIKQAVKSKFKAEFIDLLPSYVHSVKSIGTTGYDQNVRFVVGSLIDIQNEDYDIVNLNGTPVVTLSATVQYDELELDRNIRELKSSNDNLAIIQSLINNDSLMQNKIKRIKMLYRKNVDTKIEPTIDDQLKTLIKLQNNNEQKVSILFANNLNSMVENDRKLQAIAEEEAKFKTELEEREKSLASLSLMNNAELKVIEAASFYAKALNDYYVTEMTAPRTLRIKSTNADSAIFEIVRVDGKPIITPWKYSFDEQLSNLFDLYPFAKFSLAQSCDLDFYDTHNENIKHVDKYNSTLKPNGQFADFASTGVTAGRFGSHKPVPYVPLGKNLIHSISENFNSFSPKFNSPFLYYYADEMRVHHVDPTANGTYKYPRYAYRINIGSRQIELPFIKKAKKKVFSSKEYNFNANFVMGRDVVIAPYKTEIMINKERRAFKREEGIQFTARRESLKKHYMDPQTPIMSSCNDEYQILSPTITLTNNELKKINNVKISVITLID